MFVRCLICEVKVATLNGIGCPEKDNSGSQAAYVMIISRDILTQDNCFVVIKAFLVLFE
jgi:hypothetical protein